MTPPHREAAVGKWVDSNLGVSHGNLIDRPTKKLPVAVAARHCVTT